MHVYHYAPYEVVALKRLMGAYSTREEEVDHLLRGDVFVDLYRVVKQGVRVGTRSYSLKDVEKLYMKREGEVESAAESIVQFELWRASQEPADARASPILAAIRAYNVDDCESTYALAGWLRERQAEERIAWIPEDRDHDEDVRPLAERDQERRDLAGRLLGLAAEQPEEEAALSTALAHLVEFHRREEKPLWWSFFERHDMTPEQHVDDPTCIGQATLQRGPVTVDRSLGYWYAFDPDQDTKIVAEDEIYVAGRPDLPLTAAEVDPEGRLLVKIGKAAHGRLGAEGMPQHASFLQHKRVSAETLADALTAVGRTWAESGTMPPALRAVLARERPRVRGHTGGALLAPEESVADGTSRVVRHLEDSALCVQGPPGSGKTFTASHVIRDLLAAGNDVGVVSNSRAAVHNVLRKVQKRVGSGFSCLSVGGKASNPFFADCPGARHAPGGRGGVAQYTGGLVGGTAWLFARDDMAGRLDYLFVDEAGQVSLANLAAMSRCARSLVLLGDQMQLSQPLQGTHPGESGKSALEYLLGEHATVPAELGVFLPTTYRLHPEICEYVSGAFYEGRLAAEARTALRILETGAAGAPLAGVRAGLLFAPVEHDGNTQASDEEVATIRDLVAALSGRARSDGDGAPPRAVTVDDMLFVAPYNMQVRRLRARLAGARVASVDKFQGQEAPIVFLSLCQSAGESPAGGRGLDFVLDPNRFNVAVSRAQCLAVVVGDPRLARGPAPSIDAMHKLNLLARLIHDAQVASL